MHSRARSVSSWVLKVTQLPKLRTLTLTPLFPSRRYSICELLAMRWTVSLTFADGYGDLPPFERRLRQTEALDERTEARAKDCDDTGRARRVPGRGADVPPRECRRHGRTARFAALVRVGRIGAVAALDREEPAVGEPDARPSRQHRRRRRRGLRRVAWRGAAGSRGRGWKRTAHGGAASLYRCTGTAVGRQVHGR